MLATICGLVGTGAVAYTFRGKLKDAALDLAQKKALEMAAEEMKRSKFEAMYKENARFLKDWEGLLKSAAKRSANVSEKLLALKAVAKSGGSEKKKHALWDEILLESILQYCMSACTVKLWYCLLQVCRTIQGRVFLHKHTAAEGLEKAEWEQLWTLVEGALRNISKSCKTLCE